MNLSTFLNKSKELEFRKWMRSPQVFENHIYYTDAIIAVRKLTLLNNGFSSSKKDMEMLVELFNNLRLESFVFKSSNVIRELKDKKKTDVKVGSVYLSRKHLLKIAKQTEVFKITLSEKPLVFLNFENCEAVLMTRLEPCDKDNIIHFY